MPVATFPEFHVTGAIHHWVRVKGSSAYLYLGTAEVTPQLQLRRYYQDAPNDEAGKTLPGQRTRDGQAATIAVSFTRWSKNTWDALLLSGSAAGLDFDMGQESRWSRGGLVFGQDDVELWQGYENSLNPNGPNRAIYSIELGRYWPRVMIEEDNQPQAGTQVERKLLIFNCQPFRVPQSSISNVNASTNERGWVLFRLDDGAFPADVLIPQ